MSSPTSPPSPAGRPSHGAKSSARIVLVIAGVVVLGSCLTCGGALALLRKAKRSSSQDGSPSTSVPLTPEVRSRSRRLAETAPPKSVDVGGAPAQEVRPAAEIPPAKALGDRHDLACAIAQRLDELGEDAVTDAERTVELYNTLTGQVRNGGFTQYFENSTGNDAAETLKLFRAAPLPAAAEGLEKASQLVFGGPPPEDRSERMDAVGRLTFAQRQQLTALEHWIFQDADALLAFAARAHSKGRLLAGQPGSERDDEVITRDVVLPSKIVADGEHLYLSERNTPFDGPRRIVRVPKAGGKRQVLADGRPDVRSFKVVGDAVLWNEGGRIMSVPKEAGTAQVVVAFTNGVVTAFAPLSPTELVATVTTSEDEEVPAGALVVVTLRDGTATWVAGAERALSPVVDGRRVYWSDGEALLVTDLDRHSTEMVADDSLPVGTAGKWLIEIQGFQGLFSQVVLAARPLAAPDQAAELTSSALLFATSPPSDVVVVGRDDPRTLIRMRVGREGSSRRRFRGFPQSISSDGESVWIATTSGESSCLDQATSAVRRVKLPAP